MNLIRNLLLAIRRPAIDDGRIEAIANAGLQNADFIRSNSSDNLNAVLASPGNQPIGPRIVYTNGLGC